jgi:hypothetical protein
VIARCLEIAILYLLAAPAVAAGLVDFRGDQREEEKLATEDAARRTGEFIRRALLP